MAFSFSVSNPGTGFALLLSLLVFISFPLPVQAHEGDAEVELLRQQILDLQTRVERLEGELEQGVPVNMARKVEPVPGGWRKAHNWNLLEEGMSDYEVIEILGEPDREKTVKKFDFWYYGDAKLSIYMRRLKGWEVPSGLDSE